MSPLINSGDDYSVLEYFKDNEKVTLYFEKKSFSL